MLHPSSPATPPFRRPLSRRSRRCLRHRCRQILRIPGLVTSLVNLVNKANVPDDLPLGLEVAPEDAAALQNQISVIENQYESERRKVDQVKTGPSRPVAGRSPGRRRRDP